MNTRVHNTPAGVALGPVDQIPDGQARNYVLQIGEAYFHGFVVRQGEAVHGYVDRCPHNGLPLAQALDDYMTPAGDFIACSWHGALFRIGSGQCIAGPCAGQGLTPWPVVNDRGTLKTA